MDNLIALSLIHVFLPSFLPSMLDLLILALVQLVLLSNCLICFYNDKMESHSASARGFSIGVMESASGLQYCCYPLCQCRAITAGTGINHKVIYITYVTALTCSVWQDMGCSEWIVMSFDF